MKLFSILALSLAAPTINLDSQQAVQAALKQMVDNLMAYYNKPGASSQGTINESDNPDASGFQWYEGGIMWGAVMEYIKVTGDATHANTVVNALTEASYRKVGSFLGTSEALAVTVEGKWNDDSKSFSIYLVLWWSLGALTGMELFGKDTPMPGGVSYFQVTDKTYQQVQAQEDPSCGGGIWWSRNRNDPKRKNYKSSITMNQQMMKGARMFILTNNPKYLSDAERSFAWMKSSGLIASDGSVNDGLDITGCSINPQKLSYKSGFLVGALAWMFQASKKPEIIQAAHLTFSQGLGAFAPGGIIRDACEPNCQKNQVSPKGTMVRGWGYLHEFTNDERVRSQLQQILKTTTQAMLASCDNNLNCLDNWSSRVPVSGTNPSDVHQQMNAVELMTAYLKTFTKGPIGQKVAAPTKAPPQDADEPGSADGKFRGGVTLLVLGLVMAMMF